ncbi:MAG TPA: hypothetical protein VLE22_05265 [Bryobacteraceae bacterium]|nr:hypothetical protein [Bryobacteraceae bacterium]
MLDTNLTLQIIESTVFLFPKLLAEVVILVTGFWLVQYMSGSMVV